MWLNLSLAILFSTLLYIILKKFTAWKVNTLHGIIINYFVAGSFAFSQHFESNLKNFHSLKNIWPELFVIGLLFISVFFIIARTTQTAGVGVASIASKMSMVIPITAGLFLYHENITFTKIAGICLAIPAVIITGKPTTPKTATRFKPELKTILLPFILFIGAGLVDTSIKLAQHYHMNENNQDLIIMAIFMFAGLTGAVKMLIDFIKDRTLPSWKSTGGGILLGIVNYFSLYYLLNALASPGSESSTVFAIVNIGVVLSSFIAGIILFSEPVSKLKYFGITIAVIAIVLLSY